MSILFMDGFDLYNSTASMGRYSGIGGSLVTGRFGGQGWQPDQNGTAMGFPITGTDTLTIGFALFVSGFSNFVSGRTIVALRNGSTTICQLGADSTCALKFGRTDYTTNNIASSSAGLLSTNNVWHYIEIVFTRNSTTGAVTVYLDGVAVITASGVNTGSSTINGFLFAPDGAFSTTRTYDDLYVTNTASRVGERRIFTSRPSADTAQKDWTPNSGTTNYTQVNETTYNDDTSYVASSTVGNKDLYDIADLPYTPASVTAVQVTYRARKDDATTRTIRANAKSGSTTANGATNPMASSYQNFYDLYETDPATSAAWTPTAVNALQIGPEVVS